MTSIDKKSSSIECMSLIFKHNRCEEDVDGAVGLSSVYFDMHGVRVAESNLCPGIYVRVSGLQVEKIMVR
ncbi:MAG: hypothetical protein ACI4BH_01510 [Muribaculaceae bacterium]